MLDVVFNHTAEGDEYGPTLSFRGLENRAYYMLEADQARYANYTGCGNTFNGNHSIVRRLIIDCLRYWVEEMHVDGFRFDLASVLSRDEWGQPLKSPQTLWTIESDPVLAGTKIIAEAWDAAGLYQVGSFIGHRWAEWNGQFRDDVRRFVKSDQRHRAEAGRAHRRQPRSVSAARSRAEPQHQLHHLPRRLHAQRSGVLQLQAQRRQRPAQRRRPRHQLQLELRRGRPDRRSSDRGAAPAADQEPARRSCSSRRARPCC